MKKKIVALVGVVLTLGGLYVNQAHGASSASSAQNKYNAAVEIACDSAKDLAYDIMIIRQTPITVDEHIQMIKDVGVNKKTEENGIKIVKLAHEKPLVESNAVGITSTSFGYEIQDKCLKDMTGLIL